MSVTISPNLIPYIAPGTLFDRLTTDTTLNVRWLVAADPVYYDSLNRPMADIAVRQLIIAKTLDALSLRLSHQSMFPFLVPCKVDTGSSEIFVPGSWIWDLHVSVPAKWENLRLAKIKRMSGHNPAGTGSGSTGTDPTYTGILRLIFTGEEENATTEVSMFYADYYIDSTLTFQYSRIAAVTAADGETNYIDPSEVDTISGFIVFRTLDTSIAEYADFFDRLPPPVGGTDLNSDGYYDNPTVYEVVDSQPSDTEDFSLLSLSHGTGFLVPSAYNSIPSSDSDFNLWLEACNFPFRIGASRTSADPVAITIPTPLFSEFNLCVPDGDEPCSTALVPDSSGIYSPVWISRCRRCDDTSNTLQFYFATYNVKEGAASTDPVEFAYMTLERDYVANQVVAIIPVDNLLLESGSDADLFLQSFGRGHARLSTLWSDAAVINAFFDSFQVIISDPADVTFNKSTTIIGAPGALSRYSRWSPTHGQFQALAGTTSDLSTPINPSSTNKYVTEADQGLGETIDFSIVTGITSNADIEDIAHRGGLAHRFFVLVVDANGTSHDYNNDILPRIVHILGRQPVMGDKWFDGTRIKTFVPLGDSGAWIG